MKCCEGLVKTTPGHLRSTTCPSLKNSADSYMHHFRYSLQLASVMVPIKTWEWKMAGRKQDDREGTQPKEARFSQDRNLPNTTHKV